MNWISKFIDDVTGVTDRKNLDSLYDRCGSLLKLMREVVTSMGRVEGENKALKAENEKLKSRHKEIVDFLETERKGLKFHVGCYERFYMGMDLAFEEVLKLMLNTDEAKEISNVL